MSQSQTAVAAAVTAAFVMEGLTCFRFPQLQQAWQLASEKGVVQLVEQVMQYVPAIETMRAAAVAVTGQDDETGAFQDEVSVPFGQWMSCEILANGGTLPDRKDAIGRIASLMCCSFSFVGSDSIDAQDAIAAAAKTLKDAAQ